MNRIENRINQAGTMVKSKLDRGEVTAEQVTALHCKLDIAMDEFCSFQEVKSLAHASGKLTYEEAQTVFAYLGDSPEHFNAQGIAVKVVLTKLLVELLEWKMGKGKRAA